MKTILLTLSLVIATFFICKATVGAGAETQVAPSAPVVLPKLNKQFMHFLLHEKPVYFNEIQLDSMRHVTDEGC